MTVRETYDGSDGDATSALYKRLQALGPRGVVAENLFRAHKCSRRAKEYRGRGHKSAAYERKNWALVNLCGVLMKHALLPDREGGLPELDMDWGWQEDTAQEFHKWVLYVELPTGQVSFHAAAHGRGPTYLAAWDSTHLSGERIVNWCEDLLGEARTQGKHPTPNIQHPTSNIQCAGNGAT